MAWICAAQSCVRGINERTETFRKKFETFFRAARPITQPMTPREHELARQLEECREALVQSRRENELLRQKIDLLIRRVFGSSSERLDKAQLELLLQLPESSMLAEPAESSTFKAASRSSRKEHAPRLPENLPVIEEVIDPEPVKAAPQSWRCIGQEVSEQLDFEP